MKRQHTLAAQLSTAALIRLGAVREAVAKYNCALIERRLNNFADCLRPIREHQRQLRDRRNRSQGGLAPRVQDHATDPVPQRRSSGLPQRDDPVSLPDKRRGKTAKLGRFARAVQAFKGDKEAALHDPSLSQRTGTRVSTTPSPSIASSASCRRVHALALSGR